ncbi:hypothetical protein BJX61DRAFT_133958 [Aspergillus egyptiacus]|nr:hypothetical protein BJX61DRAFT_133958 [Aspergillus egyptiacus]
MMKRLLLMWYLGSRKPVGVPKSLFVATFRCIPCQGQGTSCPNMNRSGSGNAMLHDSDQLGSPVSPGPGNLTPADMAHHCGKIDEEMTIMGPE